MKTTVELLEDRAHLIKCNADLIDKVEKEDRVLTEDEKGEFDQRQTDVDALENTIKQRQEHERRVEVSDKMGETLKRPGRRITTPDPVAGPEPPDPDDVPKTRGEVVHRYSTLHAFNGEGAEERAYRSGMWMQAALFGNERARRWCQSHGVEYRALSETVNIAGGALVPEEFLQAIIDLREKYGVFRRECDIVPMGRDIMTIPRKAGSVTASFTDENASISESEPTFNQVTVTAKKLGILTRMSTELAEDATINMADWLARDMAWAFAKKEDQCGFIGDGSPTYGSIQGITPKIIDGTHTAGAVDAASGIDQFFEITATDLTTVMAALPEYAVDNAKWYCSKVCFDLVFSRLAVTAGANTIQSISGAFAPSFLGYPIVVSQVLPTTTGDLSNVVMLLFGDLRMAATLGDRRGISVKTTTERYFAEDQIGIKATERFDINVHDLGDNTDSGPIVALIGE